MQTRLYLDHAATTPMLAEARAAVAEGMGRWANPSSPHTEGRAARAALEDARARIARAYGWGSETILTSGASESLAIALGRSVAGRRLIGATEHDSAIRAAPGARVLPVGADGLIDMKALEEELARHTHPFVSSEVEKHAPGTGFSTALEANGGRVLVAVQWANSETGVRQPLTAIADAVHAAGGLLLVDAAQMPAGADDLSFADFVAISAHKRGGPPGVGALLVRDLATLTPVGGQERGYRAGTENLPGALGFAAALEVAEPLAPMAMLRTKLDDAIRRSGGDVVAEGTERHPAIGSYRMRGLAAATQLVRFDMAGIAVSAGSACSSGSMKPSHVLTAMGWDAEAAREVIRVSFGRSTTEADVNRVVAEWRSISRSTRAFAA